MILSLVAPDALWTVSGGNLAPFTEVKVNPIEFWRGPFGDSYSHRNPCTPEAIEARRVLWDEILDRCGGYANGPRSILEVGANIGLNLRAIDLLTSAKLFAVEPNDRARQVLIDDGVVIPGDAYAGIDDMIGVVDLVFTSGCLIHIPPDDLLGFCSRIYTRASRYIVAIEYFAAEPEEKLYRGHAGKLWKRDFGAFYLDNFPDLEPLGCGFAWKRMTGLDNLTYWIFEKK